MVHWDFLDDNETASFQNGNKAPMKSEIVEDPLEEKYGPFSKRSKLSTEVIQQRGAGANADSFPPSWYNPLDEPSPLGLRLRKSPSLLDLIEIALSRGGASATPAAQQSESHKEETRGTSVPSNNEKLKASNFPASILKIGSWEYKSKYEGDLVAKCYFAKHKLVWEILEGGLKSKIEIQWSDVLGLKANCPDNGPGTLIVMVARPPLFFKETNPQPRKHTLWHPAVDFTGGQASMHRKHFLECPQGVLDKHFEKLIQSDVRLYVLSQQADKNFGSPHFEQRAYVFDDLDKSKTQDVNQMVSLRGSSISGFQDSSSPSAALSSSLEISKEDVAGTTSEHLSREAASPSSGTNTCAIEGNGAHSEVDSKRTYNWDRIELPGLHPSMLMSDFMKHIGNCLSEHMTSGNESFSADDLKTLEEITQYLFSDTHLISPSDEKRIMSRVNSLHCVLQPEPALNQSLQVNNRESCIQESNNENYVQVDRFDDVVHADKHGLDGKAAEVNTNDVSFCRQALGMSRKDSFSELLLHLPRIASLPKLLPNVSKDGNDINERWC